MINEREEKVNGIDKVLKQREKAIEEEMEKINLANLAVKEKEDDIKVRLESVAVKEEVNLLLIYISSLKTCNNLLSFLIYFCRIEMSNLVHWYACGL